MKTSKRHRFVSSLLCAALVVSMIAGGAAFAAPWGGQAKVEATSFKVGHTSPEIVADFHSGPWKGATGDVVKAAGKSPVVVMMANLVQTDMDTVLVLGDTLEEVRTRHNEAGLKVAIVGFYLGNPNGIGSKEWLTGQLDTLGKVLAHPEISIGSTSISGKVVSSFELKPGFKNATFVIHGGVVKAVIDAVGDSKADRAKLAKAIDGALP